MHSFDCHTATKNVGGESVTPNEFLIFSRMPLKEQMRSSIGNKCLSYSGQMKPLWCPRKICCSQYMTKTELLERVQKLLPLVQRPPTAGVVQQSVEGGGG